MFNLAVFVVIMAVSVAVCFLLAAMCRAADGGKFSSLSFLLLMAFLFCPFNMNGNIYTVFGSAKSEGNIYSVFSPYQSGKNTYALFGSLYQQAENDAAVIVGLAGYQQAGNDIIVVLGLAGYQQAGNKVIAFMAGYQKSENIAKAVMAGYQEVGAESRYFGLFSKLGKAPEPTKKEQ